MSTRLERLDLTIDWAIGVIVAVLALSFASPDSPPYFLLIGMLGLTTFLLFDIRRYRAFDAARPRVRMIRGKRLRQCVQSRRDGPSGLADRNRG